jgi:acyl-CoA thioesterase
MSSEAVQKIWKRIEQEKYPKLLGIEVLEVEPGRARVAMTFGEELTNIYGKLHGGAVFSLLDEAFQLACNAHGTIAVALSLNIYYLTTADPGARLLAECREINATRKTALYDAEVWQEDGKKIATGQAQAYRVGKPLPFDQEGNLVE